MVNLNIVLFKLKSLTFSELLAIAALVLLSMSIGLSFSDNLNFLNELTFSSNGENYLLSWKSEIKKSSFV